MTRETISTLIKEFISKNGGASKLWKCSVYTSPQFQAIIEFGCTYKCESNEDAITIKNELIILGLKDVGNSSVAVPYIHKFISVFK